MICVLTRRFDIIGLGPDAEEDETGIKKAAESSVYIFSV